MGHVEANGSRVGKINGHAKASKKKQFKRVFKTPVLLHNLTL